MSKLDHFHVNVSDLSKSVDFYDEVLSRLEWRKEMIEEDVVGYTNGKIWLFLSQVEKRFRKYGFHRKRIGLNHIAFFVDSKEKVDNFFEFLKQKKFIWLYDGPKEYPEYSKGYYAVYFEDPDRIKLEVVYVPKK